MYDRALLVQMMLRPCLGLQVSSAHSEFINCNNNVNDNDNANANDSDYDNDNNYNIYDNNNNNNNGNSDDINKNNNRMMSLHPRIYRAMFHHYRRGLFTYCVLVKHAQSFMSFKY